jgi:hypothetical protein
MPLSLVDVGVEDIIDRFADEGSQVEELAVDPVKGGLEEVSLAGIFAVK